MHPRKTNNPASSRGKSRLRKRSPSSTSTGTSIPRSPLTNATISSHSPLQQNEPASPLTCHAGISTETLDSSKAFGVPTQSIGNSNGLFDFSPSVQPTSTSPNSNSFQPHPTLPHRPQRPQAIPISFLMNPYPQSPRPFTFSSPAPSSPSPPPIESPSVVVTPQIDSSSKPSYQSYPQFTSTTPTRPHALPPHHDLSSATSRSHSECQPYSTSPLSLLYTQSENSLLSPSTSEHTIRSDSDVGIHSAGISISSSTPSSKRPSMDQFDNHYKTIRIDTSASTSTYLLRPESTIINPSSYDSTSRGRSNSSGSRPFTNEEHHQQQAIAAEELNPLPSPRQVSLRRTTNPDLKTTKTGKILHKTKKVGVNKKSTAYNRFLQQQSKYLAKHHPDLTPQQRMKLIAERWAVSEKNAHTTRRRSRFSTEESGKHQMPSDLHLPSSSSLPPLSPPAAYSTSSAPSHAVTRSISSNTTTTANAPSSSSSSSSSSSVIAGPINSSSKSTRSRSGHTIATPHDRSFSSTATIPQEAGPRRPLNPSPFSLFTGTPAEAAVSQTNARALGCIPASSSSVHIEENRIEDEHEE